MKPLHNVIEILNSHPTATRNEDLIKKNAGLGPPDMVILKKNSKKTTESLYYHHVAGILIQDEDNLWGYFNSLLAARPRRHISGFLYDIPEMYYYCWNSFQNIDVRFHLILKEHKIDISFYQSNFRAITELSSDSSNTESIQSFKMDSKMWNELAYSSVFRFWYPSDPLFRALFSFSDVYYPALRLIPPQSLSVENLRYLLKNYSLCDEVYAALSAYLVYLGNSNLLLSLVHDFEATHPHLPCYLYQFLPKQSTCPLIQSLFGYIAEAFYKCPDDPLLVSSFIEIALIFENESPFGASERFDHLLPFLISACWSTPIACIGLAKLCLKSSHYDNAFFALNASCFAKNPVYRPKFPKTPLSVLGQVSFSKQGLCPKIKRFEGLIIKSQPELIDSLFYNAILQFVKAVTPEIAIQMVNKRSTARKTQKILSQRKHEIDLSTSDFSEKSDFTDASTSESDADPFQFLFDPGVTSDLSIPPAMKVLPLHAHFIEVVNTVIQDLFLTSNLFSGFEETPSLAKIEEACMVSLRTRNYQLYEQTIAYFKKFKKFKVVNELIGTRIAMDCGKGKEIVLEPNPKMTIQEFNTFLVMRELLSGLSELLK